MATDGQNNRGIFNMATQQVVSPIWQVDGFEYQTIIGTNNSGHKYIINQMRRVGQKVWSIVMEAEVETDAYTKFDPLSK